MKDDSSNSGNPIFWESGHCAFFETNFFVSPFLVVTNMLSCFSDTEVDLNHHCWPLDVGNNVGDH